MTPSEKEIQVKEDENTSIKNHILVLPYQGEKGIHIVNSIKSYVNKILPKNVKVQTAFTGKRLSSCFKTKENCLDDYIGESARCIIERIKDHGGRDTKSHFKTY